MYNTLKTYNNQIYTGMKVGSSHVWKYNNGLWYETKQSPNKWSFQFDCIKTRAKSAPFNSGANVNTKYHWYIIADQIATKMDADSYTTSMKGIKFKIGHKRPYWKTFSYNYPEQITYKERIIQLLEEMLNRLKKESKIY